MGLWEWMEEKYKTAKARYDAKRVIAEEHKRYNALIDDARDSGDFGRMSIYAGIKGVLRSNEKAIERSNNAFEIDVIKTATSAASVAGRIAGDKVRKKK